MKIRPIEEKDIHIVVDLIHQNLDEVIPLYHSQMLINKIKSEITSDQIRFEMNRKQMFIVEANEEIVATGSLANFGSNESPKHCLSNFYVKTSLHRKGIGSLLIDHLLNVAQFNRITYLHVPSSRNAIPFYEKRGFIKDDLQLDMADEITWMILKLKIKESSH